MQTNPVSFSEQIQTEPYIDRETKNTGAQNRLGEYQMHSATCTDTDSEATY